MKRRTLLATVAATGVLGCLDGFDDSTDGTSEYAWKHEIPGENTVVSDGRLFGEELHPGAGEGERRSDDADGSGGVFSLDERTGDHQWTYGASDARLSGYRTPIVKDAVYVAKQNDTTSWPFAIEFDGTERWSGTSGYDTLSGRFGDVIDGVAYLVDRETIRAVDAASGDELWTAPGSSLRFDTTVETPGTAFVAGGELVSLDTTDGSVRWRYEHEDTGSTVCAVADGVAYAALRPGFLVAVADGEERWRAELSDVVYDCVIADRSVVVRGDSRVYAFDAVTGERRWVREVTGEVRVHDNAVYVGRGDHHDPSGVSAFALDDGSEIWSLEAGDTDQYVRLSVDAIGADRADDRSLFVQTGERELRRVSPAGDVIQTWTVESALHDFAVGEFVVVSTDTGLYALEPQ